MLNIFPAYGFDQSVLTPVLIGLLVSWLFTETVGWVFAGLVVPGYLAALFLVNPAAATLDVIEAMVTYGVARILGEHLARLSLTSSFFGRERFFLVVVVSIVVRVLVEAVLLPRALSQTTWAFSVGLVVVPLAANSCWKTGLVRGTVQNGLPTLITYLLLRYVFERYTNLSIKGFELATENVLAGLLASPKPYILLITGALLASIGNIRWGWDYNGILVPALLGLVVTEPTRFLATIVEALILFGLGSLLAKKVVLEGPRRVVAFFVLDYFLRFAFATALGRTLPGGDIAQLMGFGYLLPTLLAVKMAQKGNPFIVLLPTVKVAAAGFAAGTALGFALASIDGSAKRALAETAPAEELPRDPALAATWLSALGYEKSPKDARANPRRPPWRELAARAGQRRLDQGSTFGIVEQELDSDIVALREPFGTGRSRAGLPAVLVRPDAAAGPRAVFVLLEPRLLAPFAARLAELLAQKTIDAIVFAGAAESDDATRAAAMEAAYEIAGGDRHSVARVEVANKVAGSIRSPRASARLAAALDALGGMAAERNASLVEGAAVTLSPNDFVKEMDVTPTLDTSDAATTVTTLPASLSAPGRPVRSSPSRDLVLRRLVVEPVLSGGSGLAFARNFAASLGYRIAGGIRPTFFGVAASGRVLLPSGAEKEVAIFARDGAGPVVVVPDGHDHLQRDAALRIAHALHARAILVRLTAHEELRHGVFGAALAISRLRQRTIRSCSSRARPIRRRLRSSPSTRGATKSDRRSPARSSAPALSRTARQG